MEFKLLVIWRTTFSVLHDLVIFFAAIGLKLFSNWLDLNSFFVALYCLVFSLKNISQCLHKTVNNVRLKIPDDDRERAAVRNDLLG